MGYESGSWNFMYLIDGKRGNLIAKINIVVPEKLTKEEIEMFKKLKEISKFNPRRV